MQHENVPRRIAVAQQHRVAQAALPHLCGTQSVVPSAAATARLARVRLVNEKETAVWILAQLVLEELAEPVVPPRQQHTRRLAAELATLVVLGALVGIGLASHHRARRKLG